MPLCLVTTAFRLCLLWSERLACFFICGFDTAASSSATPASTAPVSLSSSLASSVVGASGGAGAGGGAALSGGKSTQTAAVKDFFTTLLNQPGGKTPASSRFAMHIKHINTRAQTHGHTTQTQTYLHAHNHIYVITDIIYLMYSIPCIMYIHAKQTFHFFFLSALSRSGLSWYCVVCRLVQ